MKRKVFSLMMGLILAFTGLVRADELTVYDGPTTVGTLPLYGYYADAYTRSQYVIPAADLSVMAGAQITGLQYYTTYTADWGVNYYVYLTEVSNTTMSGLIDRSAATVVYTGHLAAANGGMTITFDTPYTYNGGNLLIGMDNLSQGTYVTCYWVATSVLNAGYYGYSYSSPTSMSSSYSTGYIPKTTFTYSGGGGTTCPLTVSPEPVDLGYRPNNCWMRPMVINVKNEGAACNINGLDFTGSYFTADLSDFDFPFALGRNEDFDVNINWGRGDGEMHENLVIDYGSNRLVGLFDVTAMAYEPVEPDVWEMARVINAAYPFEYRDTPTTVTLYDNYLLPGNAQDGPDAVYKVTFNQDVMLNGTVTVVGSDEMAENAKMAVYTQAGIDAVGGPDLTNFYVGPTIGGGQGSESYDVVFGDETTTSTTGYYPCYHLYNYSLSESLYHAADLQTAGMGAGVINSIGYNTSDTYGFTMNGVKIWMANVSDAEVGTTSHITAGMTCVYEGSFTQVQGWNEFALNGNFAWDGTSNLLVVFQMNNGSWGSTINWKSMPTSYVAGFVDFNDYTPYSPETNTYDYYYTHSMLPVTHFVGGGRNRSDVLTYNFDDGTLQGWTTIDANGDGYNWFASSSYGSNSGSYAAVSESYRGALSPDNYLVSPQVTLGEGASISFYEASYYGYEEPIYLMVSTTGTNPSDFTSIQNWTFFNDHQYGFEQQTVDLSAYAGQQVYLAFRHYGSYDQYKILIDDITIDLGGTPGPVPPTPEIEYIIDGMTMVPGTYYIAASSTQDAWDVVLNAVELPCPEAAYQPTPADDADELEPAAVNLSWTLGQYTTEYRLVFGSTYYCEDVLVDWTTDLAQSYTVRNLYNNTNYFWRVDERNGNCETLGQVWGFTTHLNVPQNLRVADETIFEGQSAVLSWNAIQDRTYRYYNIYQDNELIGSTPANQVVTTYTVDGLTYNMDGYSFYVTAVYDEGESAPSNAVEVKVSGNGSVAGHVYEQDGETGIANATVTFTGTDEFGDNQTFNFITDATGAYGGAIMAGEYNGQAACEGYQTITQPTCGNPVNFTYAQTTTPVDFVMDENFDPVCEVIAQYYPDSLNPASPYVKVYWGCGLPGSSMIEDFETGDFSQFDYNFPGSYPWEIVTTHPYEGQYCMKSGGTNIASASSSVEVTVEIPRDGLMSFYSYISCESSWDNGYYYMDGVQMGSVTGQGNNWVMKEFAVTEGTHTFKWTYTKDSSVNSGEDAWFVDYIDFIHDAEPPVPGDTFTFDDGTMQGWTTIDADGDGRNFMVASSLMSGVAGHNGSADFVFSQSYDNSSGIVYPDNYLVSPQVQLGGMVRFYACAQDASYAAEHFGVAVSTAGNTNAADFTTIQEWTMTAKSVSAPAGKSVMGNRSGRDQGNWYEYTVDLSAYSGMGYVAIRHFNCSDQFYLDVDDITIGEPGRAAANDRAFSHYRVYRTNCYQESPYTEQNTVVLACELLDTLYIDVSWPDAAPGVYKWGVGVVYAGNRESEITWSEPVVVPAQGETAEATRDIIEIGNGTSTTYHTPFNSLWGYSVVEQIYTAAEIGTAGAINSISFNMDPAYTAQTNSVEVFMKNVTRSDFTGGYEPLAATDMVYSGTVTFNPGWTTITLDTPFQYDGTSNLMIALHEYTPGYSTRYFYYTDAANAAISFHSDSSNPDPYNLGSFSGSNYLSNNRANIQLDITAGGGNHEPIQEPRESPIVWSNCLDKDMYLNGVSVNVLLNSADSPEGVNVALTNLNEAEQEMYPVDPVILDGTGYYAWESFRRGDYAVSVTFDGYYPIYDTVSIWSDTELRYVMTEILAPINTSIYVSRTGWAMWDDIIGPTPGPTPGGETEFTEGFEGGLNGWTVLNASGEGSWIHSDDNLGGYDYTVLAHTGTGFAMGYSFVDYVGAVNIDSYLITPQKYSITNGSTLTFWADNANDSYPEGFSVCVATADNPTAADFTQVWSGAAKAGNVEKASVRHDENRYENWRQHTIDLSAYAGQNVYIAFHDVNYDMYEIWIDDVQLTSGAKDGDRHFEYYKVMCTSIDGVPIYNHNTVIPMCQLDTNDPYQAPLVEGDHYLVKVAVMYSTGMSAWSEPVEWVYEPCDHWGPVDYVDLNSTSEGNHIAWDFTQGFNPYDPVGPVPPTPGDTEFSFSFDSNADGWTTINADGDDHDWYHSSEAGNHSTLAITSHTGAGHMMSESYCNATWAALHPDEYLVTPQMYSIVNGSTFSFWACAQDASYAAEHFGVAISTTGNTNAADFTTINEWTLTAKGSGKVNPAATRDGEGTREGNWYQYTCDLSAYAGQNVYIAIRHFGCSDMFIMCMDDAQLTAGAKGANAFASGMTGNAYAFNITDVANFDERVYVLYNLYNDVRFDVINGEADGMFMISAAAGYEDMDLEEVVNDFMFQNNNQFRMMDKVQAADVAREYKSALPASFTNSLMNDIYVASRQNNLCETADPFCTDQPAYEFPAGVNAGSGENGPYYDCLYTTPNPAWYYMKISEPGDMDIYMYSTPGEDIDFCCWGPFADPTSACPNGLTADKVVSCSYSAQPTEHCMIPATAQTGEYYILVITNYSNSPCNINFSKVAGSGSTDCTIIDVDIIGFLITLDGEYLDIVGPTVREYTHEGEYGDHVYCVRPIYPGEMTLPDHNYGWSMGCPICSDQPIPTDCEPGAPIRGEYVWNNANDFGALISWGEQAEPIAEWLYYDNGTNEDAIGLTGGGSFYWGIMIPSAQLGAYAGCSLTKVSLYDYTAHTGKVIIYQGGSNAPGTPIHQDNYTMTGSNDYVEVALSAALPIDPSQNLWIVFNNNDGDYVASCCANTGDANGRWISLDGTTWEDVASYGLTNTWQIRAYVTNMAKGATPKAIEAPALNGTPNGILAKAGVSKQGNRPAYTARAAELVKYNIYRSVDNVDYELIASVDAVEGQNYYEYFDATVAGTYYFQVRALYSDGCESRPAVSEANPANDYVIVIVTSVAENGEVALYPNPTNGNITIQAQNMNRITVVSVLGQVVYDETIEGDQQIINMAQFNAGVYMVRIATENGVSTQRVTVVK